MADAVLFDKDVIARKPHQCAHCRAEIAIGARHRSTVQIYDGRFNADRTHHECEAAFKDLNYRLRDAHWSDELHFLADDDIEDGEREWLRETHPVVAERLWPASAPRSTSPPTSGSEGGERLLRQLRALAVALHEKHYADDGAGWQPLEDAEGILSQIDNMTTGLSRLSLTAERLDAACASYWDGVWNDRDCWTGDEKDRERERMRRATGSILAKPASSPAGGDGVREAWEAWDAPEDSDFLTRASLAKSAFFAGYRSALALFAPILAEKEREKAAALGLVQGHAAVIASLEARALAAEAAVDEWKERAGDSYEAGYQAALAQIAAPGAAMEAP